MIDEARTPLIISGRGDKSTDLYKVADRFARTLKMYKVKELDDKEEHDDVIDADYIVDEKAKTATLTKSGVKKAEEFFGLENLMDMENSTISTTSTRQSRRTAPCSATSTTLSRTMRL